MVMPAGSSCGDGCQRNRAGPSVVFCLRAILLLAPGCLAPKGAAGPTAGSGATWGAGIGDAGPDGLVTRVGGGAGVAGQAGTQKH